MVLPIFLDANIPIYAAGRPHPLQAPCLQVLGLAAAHPEAFYTNSEVLQQLLHRYLRLGIWPRGRDHLMDFASVLRGRIVEVTDQDVLEAAISADQYPGMNSRDLVHAAVMRRVGADSVVSADHHFDRFSSLRRLDPADLANWRAKVEL
jgi:predicted nucleic acid-binding protein